VKPVHEYEGEVFSTSDYFIFIGKSINNKKIEIVRINFQDIEEIEHEFDDFYKRRFAIKQKPIKISVNNTHQFKIIYLITNWTKSLLLLPSAISIRKHRKLHEFLINNTGR